MLARAIQLICQGSITNVNTQDLDRLLEEHTTILENLGRYLGLVEDSVNEIRAKQIYAERIVRRLNSMRLLAQESDKELLRAGQLLVLKPAVERDSSMFGHLRFPSDDASNGQAHGNLQYLHDLRVITEAMGAAVTRCSRDLRYLWVNGHCANWLGLTPEQMIGRPIRDVIGDEAFEEIRPYCERALAGERVEYEKKVHFKARPSCWLHAIYNPTFGSDGTTDGWVAVVVDVDERHRAEDALHEQNRLLLSLNEVGNFLVTENGIEGALQMILDAEIEAAHADFGTLQLFDKETKALCIVAQRGFNAEFLEYFSEFHDNRGACGRVKGSMERVVVEDVSTSPIFSEAGIRGVMNRAGVRALLSKPLIGRTGDLMGVITVHFQNTHKFDEHELQTVKLFARQAADLIEHHRMRTKQKQGEEVIRLASEAKDEFLAMLGHELRNPLTPITLSLELLNRRGEANSREHQIIRRQVQHLTRLVDDLLDVQRFARGKIDIRRERLQLRTIIMSAVETALPALESKNHEFELQVPDPGFMVYGDLERLRQVFANLLENAGKYTPAGGRIIVRGYLDASEVVTEVIDDGEGIEPELLPRIFDMFTQRPRTLDRREGGLGLGLTIVKNIMDAHGGRVTAESDGRGKGSRFTVRLPLPPKTAVRESKQEDMPEVQSRKLLRVLVVDDNADVTQSTVEGLRLFGHEVKFAADGLTALDLLSEFSPDVALLDIGLPVMDGYELATRITEKKQKHAPIMIAFTGYGQPADLEKSRRAGFQAHLVKPVKLDALLNTLAALPLP